MMVGIRVEVRSCAGRGDGRKGRVRDGGEGGGLDAGRGGWRKGRQGRVGLMTQRKVTVRNNVASLNARLTCRPNPPPPASYPLYPSPAY
ncbi:hypothetical protein Pmani_009193 [Petrolisthes manimaculis]|uniref:Uncharacterized protein n=1 Tax=Petrolisthes manimaculis TaxID=1843537 RepID=A0AAE1Q4S1_9EUCA|nr:hypothetical protein Pmani_009193 [Petrolisthes manimaculis]